MDDKYLHQQGEIITDLTIRITALERLLIKKNIVTQDEFMGALGEVRDEFVKLIEDQIHAQKANDQKQE